MLDEEIERLRKGFTRLEDQERRLIRLYAFGDVDEKFIKKEMEQIKKQRAELEGDLVKLEKQKLQVASLDEVCDQLQNREGFSWPAQPGPGGLRCLQP